MKLSVYVIGSNPLPIVIAMAYDFGIVNSRQKVSDKTLCIYSDQTITYFESIKRWLKRKEITMEPIGVCVNDIHNSLAVYNIVKTQIAQQLSSKDYTEIFLNTTGGTKVMSTNVVLAIRDVVAEQSLPKESLTEADIDPDNGKILINKPLLKESCGIFPQGSIEEAFGDTITIDDIVDLYNYKKQKSNAKFTLEPVDKTINFGKEILDNRETYNSFQTLFFKLRELLEAASELEKHDININVDEICSGMTDDGSKSFLKFLNRDKKNYKAEKFFDSQGESTKRIYEIFTRYGLVDEKQGGNITKDNCKYITGVWLEEYIWALLSQIAGEESRYEIQNNFEICPKDGGVSGNTFEIDLVFRNGFDITFISCTTDTTKHLSNSKTQQVLANSESLGLRTKTLLITMCENSSEAFSARNKAFSSQYYKNLNFLCMNDLLQDDLPSILKEKLNINT